MIGATLGTYRLVDKLGEGGMGEVYRALDEMLDRDVALKMLRPELAQRPKTVERFRAEAVALARLDHGGIARIHGFARHEDRWFIVMEFVRGETLMARLARAGRLPWTEAVSIVCQLLDALEYAHRQHVIHRDMKPANVLVGADGRVKVTDFGIARVLGTERATRTGHVVGTLEYMAPEQVRGEEVDGRADLYAVGIVLYELLTGRVPFSATSEYDVMMQQLNAPVPSIARAAPDAPAWFDGVLKRALAKSRDHRFASAAEFQAAIETLAAGEPAMRVKATRLAVPRATQPAVEAPETVLAGAAIPPTRLASPAPAAAPLPTPPGMAVSAAMPLAGLTWRQGIAAGAVLLVVLAIGGVLVRVLTRTPVEVTTTAAAAPATAEATPVAPSASRGGDVYEAPAPEPALPPAAVAPPLLGGAPPVRLPAAPPSRLAPPSAAPPSSASPAPPIEDRPAAPPAPSDAPAEAAPAPAAAEANSVEFEEVGLFSTGAEADEREVMLRFESSRLVLIDADSEGVLRTLPYRSLTEATYARARHPVAKAERDRPTLVRGLAKGMGLFRRTPHWLTLEGAGAPVVLKVDGGDVEQMLSLLEMRANLKAARVSEK